MNTTVFKTLFIVFLLVMASVAVSAAPGVPHQFYGQVLVNGQPAPDNYLVEARIEGVAKQAFTVDGAYGYDPIFYIEDPTNDRAGKSITFYVGPSVDALVEATTYVFNNGWSTHLDLSVSIASSSGGSSSGSSRHSGGGSSVYIPSTSESDDDELVNETVVNETVVNETSMNESNETIISCSPDWLCTAWGECINGFQKRSCVDQNNCAVTNETLAEKPVEKQACSMSVEELYGAAPNDEQQPSFLNRITGAVIGGGIVSWGLLVGFLLVLLGLVGFAWSRRRRAEKKRS